MAASIGLLILIIATFAANNLQRTRTLLTENLFRRGQMVVRFVGAGMRASMMMGSQGATQTQQLIEQAAEDEAILYIAVIVKDGTIVAHSNPDMINKKAAIDFDGLQPTGKRGRWHIVSSPEFDTQVFEVVSPLDPFRLGRGGRKMRRHMRHMMGPVERENVEPQQPFDNEGQQSLPPNIWDKQFKGNKQQQGQTDLTILIGLDMSELETVIEQHRYNIFITSLVLLLIGLGGWVSVLALQNYRSSENTLKQMQAFTGLLISRLPVGIITTDRDGLINTFNPAAAAMTGHEATKAINRKPGAILPSMLSDFFMLQHEGNEILDKDIVLPSQEGSLLTLHVSSVPIYDEEGLANGRVLLLYDLTELKRLEKQVQRHEWLVSLGKMAAGVAHEVRNPLSSIKGFATLLGSRFSEDSDEKEAADLLITEVERLNRSVTELLNFAKPLPLERKPVDLREAIPDSLKLVDSDAKELQVTISHELSPDLPRISADSDRLNQVLLNLYLNALQAMEHGGKLTVRARHKKKEKMVDIEIKDTGVGIPEKLLDRILDPYFTTKPEGTGLGLAMVYKIIDEHGGTIKFDSEVGKGTTVTVSLPVHTASS